MREGYKDGKISFILIAMLLTTIGAILIFANERADVIGITAGITLMLFGALYFLVALIDTQRGFIFIMRTIIASLFFACGLLLIIFNKDAVFILIDIISFSLIVDGAFKIKRAVASQKLSVRLWWVLLIPSVISLVGAILLLQLPLPDGLSLIFLGSVAIIEAVANAISLPMSIISEQKAEAEIYYEVVRKDLMKTAKSRKKDD